MSESTPSDARISRLVLVGSVTTLIGVGLAVWAMFDLSGHGWLARTADESLLRFQVRPQAWVSFLALGLGLLPLAVVSFRMCATEWKESAGRSSVVRLFKVLPAFFLPVAALGALLGGIGLARYELALTKDGVRYVGRLAAPAFSAAWDDVKRARMTEYWEWSWKNLKKRRRVYIELSGPTGSTEIGLTDYSLSEVNEIMEHFARRGVQFGPGGEEGGKAGGAEHPGGGAEHPGGK